MYGKTRKPEKEFNINEFDDILNSSLKGLEDSEDITDPDLLKQLQEITSGSDVKVKKPKPEPKKRLQQAANMDIDVDAYTSLAQGDDDIEVDFDEGDLNDPNLLSELSLLSKDVKEDVSETIPPTTEKTKEVSELMNMGFSQQQAEKALSMFDNNLERAANYLFDAPMDMEEPPVEQSKTIAEPKQPIIESKQPMVIEQEVKPMEIDESLQGEEEDVESEDPEYYRNKAKEYQKLALEAKRSGDKKKAVTLLRHSKVLNQKCQELLEKQQSANIEPEENQPQTIDPKDVQNKDISPPVQKSPKPESIVEPEYVAPPAPVKEAEEATQTVQEEQVNRQTQQSQILLGDAIALQKQYKEAALHYKGLGNIPVAKDMLRTSKELLQTAVKLKNGEIVNLNSVKLPSPPDMTLGDGKIRQIVEVSRLPTTLDQIESQLTYQMNICHNLSVQNRSTKRATNSRMLNDNTQDAFLKAEEAFSVDIMTLRSQSSVPKLHYEQVNYNYKNILDTIPDNMMEFKIIRAISLPTLDVSNKLDPFVTWDFGGWPPENTAQAALNRGETPVLSGADPEFNFSTLIPISRTNRLFQRYLQRKKVTVEVFHNKYSYGLFRRPVSLGKVVIPMDRLLTKSSISGVFDLLDGRKKTGGKIELEINLREPLTGEDIAKRSERWLIIDDLGSTASQYLSLAGLTVGGSYVPTTPTVADSSTPNPSKPVSAKLPASDSPKPAAGKSPKLDSPKPTEQRREEATTTQVKDDLEAAEIEFDSVDSIVSNMVMEHEMNLVDAALASGRSTKSRDDLVDRKQDLELKMNMLVTQVQTGLLDMETYLRNVEKRIDADTKLALVFKRNKRLDLAMQTMKRIKIMENEVGEARAAMQANEE